jgi:hypothetical protein
MRSSKVKTKSLEIGDKALYNLKIECHNQSSRGEQGGISQVPVDLDGVGVCLGI